MSYINVARAMIACCAVLGGVLGSWWVPAFAMFLLSVRFRAWEVPFIGLLVDLIWLPYGGIFSHPPIFTIYGIAIVWLLEPMRKQFLL